MQKMALALKDAAAIVRLSRLVFGPMIVVVSYNTKATTTATTPVKLTTTIWGICLYVVSVVAAATCTNENGFKC